MLERVFRGKNKAATDETGVQTKHKTYIILSAVQQVTAKYTNN